MSWAFCFSDISFASAKRCQSHVYVCACVRVPWSVVVIQKVSQDRSLQGSWTPLLARWSGWVFVQECNTLIRFLDDIGKHPLSLTKNKHIDWTMNLKANIVHVCSKPKKTHWCKPSQLLRRCAVKLLTKLLTGPASPSNAMTSPLLAFKRPRRTAGTSSPLKWMAT